MSDISDRVGLQPLSEWTSGVTAHVGLEVPDLDEARRFYCDLLGFEEIAQIKVGGDFLESLTGLKDAEVESIMLKVRGGIQIELQKYTPQGTVRENAVNNQGLTHLSFGVQNVQAEYERLLAAGVKFSCEPVAMELPEHPMDGHTVVYLEDPWGLPLELMGPTPSA
jgi:catechol 2,3-dioxygenase-like lactoylglutathione lyase family enzyme